MRRRCSSIGRAWRSGGSWGRPVFLTPPYPDRWTEPVPGVRPGSTLKPFIYGMALDQGLIHPQTLLPDSPRSFGGYDPENFDRVFRGPLPAHEALRASRNLPAILLASQLRPGFYGFLLRAGGGSPVQRGPLRPQPRARRRGGFHARAWRPVCYAGEQGRVAGIPVCTRGMRLVPPCLCCRPRPPS